MSRAQVATLAESWAHDGVTMAWTNVPNLSSLTQWATQRLAGQTPPLPMVVPTTTLLCHELPLLAAVSCGALSPAALTALYQKNLQDHPSWSDILNGYWFSSPTVYDRGAQGPLPAAGDLVFFDGTGHVAIATGRTSQDGAPRVGSFWGFSPIPTATQAMSVATPVTVDSAEALAMLMDAARLLMAPTAPPVVISFATPPW